MPEARRRYTVQIEQDVLRQIAALPKDVRVRVDVKIQALADDPRPPGSRKLSGHDELYRFRVGHYRVVYAVRDELLLVIVVRVAHRSKVYQRLPKITRGN